MPRSPTFTVAAGFRWLRFAGEIRREVLTKRRLAATGGWHWHIPDNRLGDARATLRAARAAPRPVLP